MNDLDRKGKAMIQASSEEEDRGWRIDLEVVWSRKALWAEEEENCHFDLAKTCCRWDCCQKKNWKEDRRSSEEVVPFFDLIVVVVAAVRQLDFFQLDHQPNL
jgi:hypothetical protein